MSLILGIALTLLGAPGSSSAKDVGRAEQELAQGQIVYGKGQYKKAVQHFSEALKHGADKVEARYWRGLAYLWLKEHKKAEQDLMSAASERSEDVGLRKALGKAQLAQGKFMWAMRQFRFVMENRPKSYSVLVDLAYCLMRMEAYDEAKEILEKVLKKAPKGKLRKRARLLLGVCHFRGDNLAQARGLLLGLRGGRWGRGASRVLDRILERESGIQKGWRATFTTGVGVDSNPVMGDEPIPGLSRSKDAALDVLLAAGFAWTPFVKGAHSLAGSVDVGRHFYLAPWDLDGAHKNVAAFSMTTVSAGGDYTYAYLTKKGPRSLRVGYLFRLVQLDGGEGLSGEDDPFLFSETHGLSLNWSLQNHKDRIMELAISPTYSAFRDRDRDGVGVSGKARWSLFFNDKKFKVFPDLSVGYNDARFEGWRYLTAGLWVGLSYRAPWKLDVSGSFSQEARVHTNSKNAFGIGQNAWQLDMDTYRHDHVTALAVGLGRTLDKKKIWRIDLSARYMRSWSTAEFFKYSRLTGLLSVSAAFDNDTW